MAVPALLAPAIGMLGSVAGNLIGNAGAANRQNRANRQNIAFWRMQNEYNHPTAQKQRLKDAGLNPNLIYGGSPSSATGNAGQISPAKAAPFRFDNPLIGLQMYADVKQKEAQTNNLNTQNSVLQQEALLKAMQTANLSEQTAKTAVEADIAKQTKQTSIQYAQENLRRLELQSIGQELDNSFKDQSMRDRVKSLMYEAENARANLKGTELLNTLRKLEVDLKKLGIERSDPWYYRILGRGWNDPDIRRNLINQIKEK